ncbi:murein transglycosylase A [Caedibacter taeniospiralis]|uniref:murein transglycosylase A n=1 Tax=Caedibacter taeniospiralis TaxID=28907 RepID=UPI000C27736B|nr:murein transglycosylase A [Caedibacter taeniospiralis]
MRKPLKILMLLTALLPLSVFSSTSISFEPVNYQALPDWDCGDQMYAYQALQISCKVILKNTNYNRDWINSCQNILSTPAHTDRRAREMLEKNFTPYLVRYDDKAEGLFTGYYAPAIAGSLYRSAEFSVPIYRTPKDLIQKKTGSGTQFGRMVDGKLIPYYTREEIAKNNYLSKKDVIVWVRSRIERTFLQIQGSGRIELENGDSILVGYDSQNGHPYRPIGRYLIENGLMPRNEITMQSIKTWLYDHPEEADKVLNYDPSFVFFRTLSHGNPIGAQGVPLTPGYSIAIDSKFYQYGTPVWLSSSYHKPNQKIHKLDRLLIAQDTGGAIRGAIRGDVFWGSGSDAEFYAGHMKNLGKMFVLLPKSNALNFVSND